MKFEVELLTVEHTYSTALFLTIWKRENITPFDFVVYKGSLLNDEPLCQNTEDFVPPKFFFLKPIKFTTYEMSILQ